MKKLILLFSFFLVCLSSQAQTITTVTYQAGQSADDCWIRQTWAGTDLFYTTVGNPWTGEWTGNYHKTLQGIRYPNVAIPQGATIISARLLIYSSASKTASPVNAYLRCEAVDDATTFSSLSDTLTRFSNSTTSVSNWEDIQGGAVGWTINSTNFNQSVQEVIDRPGWSSGNALVVFIDDRDSRSSENKNFGHYDSDPATSIKLEIEYFTDNNADVYPIIAAEDDVTAQYNGSSWSLVNRKSTEVGYFNSSSYRRTMGLCFRNIAIPIGSTITNAQLIYRSKYSYSSTAYGRISAEDVDSGTGFTDISDWSSRFPGNITTAQIGPYLLPAQSGDNDPDYSNDFSTVIQEIIDRPGWSSGNNITVFFDDYADNSTHASNTQRIGYAYEFGNNSATTVQLLVQWTPPETSDVNNWFFVP